MQPLPPLAHTFEEMYGGQPPEDSRSEGLRLLDLNDIDRSLLRQYLSRLVIEEGSPQRAMKNLGYRHLESWTGKTRRGKQISPKIKNLWQTAADLLKEMHPEDFHE